jgi:hypothetical protein
MLFQTVKNIEKFSIKFKRYNSWKISIPKRVLNKEYLSQSWNVEMKWMDGVF